MYVWMSEDISVEQTHEHQNNILTNIRTYIAALLLMTPTLQVQSEDNLDIQTQGELTWVYREHHNSEEHTETIASYETIFKNGIKNALHGINSINQIPLWGKHIEYYRNEWWPKLSPESVQKLGLPTTFDIMPRNVTQPTSSMYFHLGNRKFKISLKHGKIANIYMTPEDLVIETSFFVDITYNKETKLPDLMFRLFKTPIGKWEKPWFRWTVVT